MAVSSKWNGDLFRVQLRANAETRLVEAALFLTTAVKKTLSGSRSGMLYRVPGARRRYRASAPGEAPASRTGNLRNAISWLLDKGALVAAVGVQEKRAPYGPHLEFGHKIIRGGKLVGSVASRPFLRPTFIANREKVKAILNTGWRI